MMKKYVSVLLAVGVGAMVMAGCSGSDSSASWEGAGSGSEAPAAEVIRIQIGYENNPGEPIDQGVNKWCEILKEKSGGTMIMETYPSSQLGSKNDLIDQMLAGESIITVADGAFYADRGVPDFGIVFAPYLFEDWDQCWTLIESDWYKEQCQKLEESGLKILTSNWKFGDRHTITKKPVNRVEDLKGMKIRVPNNMIQIKGFEVLNAAPTPMAFGDVYTALQQGTIDGLENTLPTLYNSKFQEVAKYIILDGHVKNFTTWVGGTEFFNSLTAEQQEWLIDSGNEAGIFNNEIYDESEQEVLEKFREEGVTIVEPDDAVMAGFREAAETFYTLPEFTSIWSEGLYDTVKAAMQ